MQTGKRKSREAKDETGYKRDRMVRGTSMKTMYTQGREETEKKKQIREQRKRERLERSEAGAACVAVGGE